MKLEVYIEKLKEFNAKFDEKNVIKAYYFAEKSHEGQFRKSGDVYMVHPIYVSLILAELGLDEDSIISGLLHDVIEDSKYEYKDILENFGKSVADIVDGVTKLGNLSFDTYEEHQVENLRKMFLAMAKDIRVILIKLADRLHNMRTLEYMSPEKKIEKARETLEIYAPIANRLGINKIKCELEDLAFLNLEPEKYYKIVAKVNKKLVEREILINDLVQKLKETLKEAELEFKIYGRPKHFYSIYRKMEFQNKNFDEIFDLTAIRIIVASVKECYGALGLVHTLWKPIPGRFKDYIAMPKPNMYQSLHTTIIGDNGEPFEIQIRTEEMHEVAEFGIAAHWKYKEGKNKEEVGENLIWIKHMMESQNDLDNPSEFMDSLRVDTFNSQVYVFTPKGKVIELPEGSTPVDFAYKIHSAVGNKCIGAKVDNHIVPLNYKLKNGNIVEVMTSKSANGPSRDWLKFVRSTQAKNKIKQFFKKERREENIEKGKEILGYEIKRQKLDSKKIFDKDIIEPILKRLSCSNLDDLYATVGYGGISINQVLPRLKERYNEKYHKIEEEDVKEISFEQEDKRQTKNQGIKVKGIEDVLVRFSKCCNPVPGDDIIGFITRGRGVSIHRADCVNFVKTNEMKDRFIEVEWIQSEESKYISELQVVFPDRKGLISEISAVVSELGYFVRGLNAKVIDELAIINITVEITDVSQLNNLIKKLKQLKDVISVKRVKS